MTDDMSGPSPRTSARIAGALYLFMIVAGVFTEAFVRQPLIVGGNPTATARNILAHEPLYRAGFALGLVYIACNVPLALLVVKLFGRAGGTLAWLAAAFILVSTAIEAVNYLNLAVPLVLLGDAPSLAALPPGQRDALSYAALRLFGTGFNMALLFFACYCLTIGWLIVRSAIVPRTIGLLMAAAGVCYLVNSLAFFLSPPLAGRLFPYILLPCLVAELALALWLLTVGVNVDRGNRRHA